MMLSSARFDGNARQISSVTNGMNGWSRRRDRLEHTTYASIAQAASGRSAAASTFAALDVPVAVLVPDEFG